MDKQTSCCTANRSEGLYDSSSDHTGLTQNVTRTELKFAEKMVKIPGGEFLMGTDDNEGFPTDGEGPVRAVQVDPFLMDKHTVTNDEFTAFVEATGYRTESERFGWSFVFYQFLPKHPQGNVQQLPSTPWWYALEGACWFQPEGEGSSVKDRLDHPVIHVSWNDAVAFSHWVGKRLPTEAEWEFAARGGLEQNRYPWGDDLTPNGTHQCNIWQGNFPSENTQEDGYVGTAPAQSFPANDYGLYNVAGNVWEWCEDWFTRAIDLTQSNDPKGPSKGTSRVMRGGSYLCHRSYCNRYRVAARSSNTPDSATGNLGFRCVADLLK
ncbi:formylglycine-generating enzyme family protein [Aureibacillus halotolerans]|uniref:Formylglycine-generating enzyme required for sulfatase activity n=1 Tax=Aureibacillus halotolerans TaxID=1508390 RepID=A0A4R6TWR8_9BACI|nr:formylglycine-generating enzyme family protein [Aureibacillus halotolerans]TDQ37706.1 formylglycine-generating enzyme required for sulfatase activity [Aureibacillus halotolerans]